MADKIALLDFCETIADFQTFDPFLQYVIAQERPRRSRVLCSTAARECCALATRVMRALGWKHYLYKLLLVRQLKGLSREKLEACGRQYYEQRVKDHLIAPTVELIAELKRLGYRLMIVSGGSELYIRWFAQEYGVDDVLSAQLEYADGICTGRLLCECMGGEKPEMLRAYIQVHDIEGELAVCASDSRSDMPLLELCQRKIILSHGRHQPWVTEDMEEIVWG